MRNAFTLAELVLVLVILSILATVALESLEPQVDQTRFETTQRTLRNIEIAVIGDDDARASNGSRRVSGFVADVGRSPLSIDELLLTPDPTEVPSYDSFKPSGDSQVTVHGGWRGPYLQLPIGGETLRDGWSNPFDFFNKDGNPLGLNEPIGILRSRGRDYQSGGNIYDKDIVLVLEATTTAVTVNPPLVTQPQDRLKRSFVVDVYSTDLTRNPDPIVGKELVVRMYGPQAIASSGKVAVGTIQQSVIEIDGSPVSLSFDDVYVGPRVIRAYQLESKTDPAKEDDLSARSDVKAMSVPTRIDVSPELSSVQLVLRDVTPLSP